MAKFTVVKFETVRLAQTIEADSIEQAIAIADDDDSAEYDEETLGTNGIEEVLDEAGARVWVDGSRQCTCDDRSWHGPEHDSACPLAGLPKGDM